MWNPEALEWVVHCAIELSEFDIRYKPWMTIKGQVLVDFITKNTGEVEHEVPLLDEYGNCNPSRWCARFEASMMQKEKMKAYLKCVKNLMASFE